MQRFLPFWKKIQTWITQSFKVTKTAANSPLFLLFAQRNLEQATLIGPARLFQLSGTETSL